MATKEIIAMKMFFSINRSRQAAIQMSSLMLLFALLWLLVPAPALGQVVGGTGPATVAFQFSVSGTMLGAAEAKHNLTRQQLELARPGAVRREAYVDSWSDSGSDITLASGNCVGPCGGGQANAWLRTRQTAGASTYIDGTLLGSGDGNDPNKIRATAAINLEKKVRVKLGPE